MTKRDYIFIANAIKQARQDLTGDELAGADIVAREVASVFAEHNAAFEVDRFLVNCGLNP